MKRFIKSYVAVAVLAGASVLNTGCIEGLIGTTSFGAGYVLGALNPFTQTNTTCFENGVEVDCGTLPEDIRPQ